MLSREIIEGMKESLKTGVKVHVAPHLFPTGVELGHRMSQMLNLQPTDEILEPQAGTGSLISACGDVWKRCKRFVAVEINYNLYKSLSTNYPEIEIYHTDFLNLTPKTLGKFDKIIMNPPFSNHQDIEHIQHAFNFLKEGGELVSVVCEGPFFRQNRKSKEFRDFLEHYGAKIIKLPRGTFKESGTMVETRLIHIKRVLQSYTGSVLDFK